MIASGTNGQIKKIKKLKKSARYRKEEGLFVAEGWKMTEEAIRYGLVRAVYVSESSMDKWQEKNLYAQLGKKGADIPVEQLSSSLFCELSDTVTPQGILALVEMPEYHLNDMTEDENAALLVLEDIQDPGNLGTMIRTAEGAGMSGVLMSKGCVDIFNPKVVRSTMGAMFRVPYVISNDLSTEVESLKEKGFTTYAAHLAGAKEYTQENYKGKAAVLIGNEANGLSDKISSQADCLIKIPMEGELESLNAAVSAALLMYEIHRNR